MSPLLGDYHTVLPVLYNIVVLNISWVLIMIFNIIFFPVEPRGINYGFTMLETDLTSKRERKGRKMVPTARGTA